MNRLKAAAPLIGLFFGAIFLGLGIINLGGTIASSSWVPQRAVVTRSAIEPASGRDGVKSPTIKYAYQRRGEDYVGTRVKYGLITSPGSARRLVARYTVGDSITVYVDPAHPNRSVMQKSGLIVPTVEVVAGILLLSLWLRAVKRERGERAGAGV